MNFGICKAEEFKSSAFLFIDKVKIKKYPGSKKVKNVILQSLIRNV